MKAIDAIGKVTADSKNKIEKAKDAYSEVPERLRDKVTNSDTLDKATERFAAIDTIKQAGTKSKEHFSTVLGTLADKRHLPRSVYRR